MTAPIILPGETLADTLGPAVEQIARRPPPVERMAEIRAEIHEQDTGWLI